MPKAVVDETGQVIKLLEYDSFGNLISDSNLDFYLPVGLAGGLADNSTGLVRFGFRDYDPVSGRWAAKDPVLFAGAQANLFTYCGNNPVNLVDSWGLRAEKAPCQADKASQEPGYLNFNVTVGYIAGVTLGGLLDADLNWHGYMGYGIVTPGVTVSVTGSPFDTVSHGWNRAVSVDLGIAASTGYSEDDETSFSELGVGLPPGLTIVRYYIF